MKYKILGKEWRSALHTVGFVAYDTDFNGEWNSVVGYVPEGNLLGVDLEGNQVITTLKGDTEEQDTQYIAANGAKIEWQIAQILFPYLDITKHKYYEKEKL